MTSFVSYTARKTMWQLIHKTILTDLQNFVILIHWTRWGRFTIH